MEHLDYKTPLVIAICEGFSDEPYLNYPLNAYFKSRYGTTCKVIRISDVTGDPNLTEEEFIKLFPTFVESELTDSKNKIDKDVAKNIKEIVHIIDIDEAFIENDLIHKDETKHFYYSREGIYSDNVDDVIERNLRKQGRIQHLLSLRSIDIFHLDIPYSLYFYSINIDDFHNENALNWDEKQKNKAAAIFERKYILKTQEGRIKLFIELFQKNNPKDFPNGLDKTWEYISINNNSTKKCSNVVLIIKPKER